MTSTPGNPGSTDFEGKAVPPYEGRRERAEVDSEQENLHRDGADVGAATGPVETGEGMKAPEPADTPRGGDKGPRAGRPPARGGRVTRRRAAGRRHPERRLRPGVGRAGAPPRDDAW